MLLCVVLTTLIYCCYLDDMIYECVFNGMCMSVFNNVVCVCPEKRRTTTGVEELTKESVLLDRSVVWVHQTLVWH